MDILAELNPAQREAVEAIGGPVLILAGPGSGKTRVIAHRVAYLIIVCRISPHRIMAVTFTNKAAREMEERLHRLIAALLTYLGISVRVNLPAVSDLIPAYNLFGIPIYKNSVITLGINIGSIAKSALECPLI